MSAPDEHAARDDTGATDRTPKPFSWSKSVKALTAQIDELVCESMGLAMPPVEEAIAEAGPAIALGEACVRCGGSVGEGEAATNGCATCREQPALADRVVRLGVYDGALREMILAIKFRRWWEMGRTLGRMLGDRVADEAQLNPKRTVVVPVPMPWQRRLFRGIDHARVIASGVAESLDAPMWFVLAKHNGTPQLSLQTSMRQAVGGRGLKIRSRLGNWPVEGCDLVLVDDVRTTGATIRRADRLLKSLKPRSVTAAVVAVADHRTRRARSEQVRTELEAVERGLARDEACAPIRTGCSEV